jgi:hypothetical protein
MSLKSLCEKHVCTLITETNTTGASLGRIVSPTEYANNRCRIVELSADKAADFLKNGMVVDYQLFFTYNPRTKTAGGKVRRIKFTDENSDVRTLKVEGEKNPDQLDRYWRYDCKEYAAVENR